MHRNRSVDTHRFAMTPSAEIPRSVFGIEKTVKTTFDSGWLIPFYVDEVLPGDSFSLRATMFGRLATPLFPVMDNLHLDTFFFFVPYRLLWTNWVRMMGEQDDPGDSTDFTIPQIVSPAGGHAALSIYDYMGLPCAGQVDPAQTYSHSALPLRAYNLIWSEWFRDENLQNRATFSKGDGPDSYSSYSLKRRGKRKDYFTSCLPWPQKGPAVGAPIGGLAPVVGSGLMAPSFKSDIDGQALGALVVGVGSNDVVVGPQANSNSQLVWDNPALQADLSQATAITINQLRESFQVQKLLERDARGGTRYTEILRSHFGVSSPDARLQRPEYLGGGSTPITINPIAQTSGTPGAGGYTDTPQGHLAAMGTVLAHGHGFSQAFVEHGLILGLVCVRADLTYQQGLRRMWSRETRYDFYFPAFAHLGEQAVLNKEIYCTGLAADEEVFGYQERWSDYRYNPSEITGLFRSTHPSTIDGWHLSQHFTALPTLAESFIIEQPPLARALAVGSGAAGQQIIMDSFLKIKAARPLPAYSVPGLLDHL